MCHEMHWTYQEFLEQPTWFIMMLHRMVSAEAEHIAKLNKR